MSEEPLSSQPRSREGVDPGGLGLSQDHRWRMLCARTDDAITLLKTKTRQPEAANPTPQLAVSRGLPAIEADTQRLPETAGIHPCDSGPMVVFKFLWRSFGRLW